MSNEPLLVGEGYTLAGTLRDRTDEPVMAGDMTLRDYFAAQSVAAVFSDAPVGTEYTSVAEQAYAFADAMLAERTKQ